MKNKILFLCLMTLFQTPAVAEDKKETIDTLFKGYQKAFKRIPAISVKQALLMQEVNDGIFVDIREDEEQTVSMIPNALTQEAFEKEKEKFRKTPVIFYCTIGSRSGKYAKKIQKEGFMVFNLKGGILSWTHEDKPIENKEGPTKKVHVYGPKWNLLPEGYEAVW